MKKIMLLSLLVLTVIFGCRLTGSGNNNNDDAYLMVENLTSLNIYLTVDDGSLGPYPEHLLTPGEVLTLGWDDSDEIFTLNNGIAFLTYRDESGEEETAQVTIFYGQTSNFTISENATILVVSNESNDDAWFRADNGDLTSLVPMESDVISFGELGYMITVQLYYTGYHVFSNTVNLDLFPYSTEEFDIEADAGAVALQNYGIPSITEVYIAPSESQYWGPDLLGSALETGEIGYWTIEPGWWDIQTINQYGEIQEFYDRYIGIDTTEFISLRGISQHLSKKKKETHQIDYQVEFKKIILP